MACATMALGRAATGSGRAASAAWGMEADPAPVLGAVVVLGRAAVVAAVAAGGAERTERCGDGDDCPV